MVGVELGLGNGNNR